MTGAGRSQIPWVREELILACDLVRQNDWHELRQTDRRVVELSNILQAPFVHPLDGRPVNFRSANSVSRKTSDLMTRLPHYSGRPTKGGRLDQVVLDEFLTEPEGMSREAARLREWVVSLRWEYAGAGERLKASGATQAAAVVSGVRDVVGEGASAEPGSAIDPGCAEALLAGAVVGSPRFTAQGARAGRSALSPDLAYLLLARLLLDGGRTPAPHLMASAGLPSRSIDPTLAVLRRLLNVDGYLVVRLDADAVTVRLDRALLVEQFGVAEDASAARSLTDSMHLRGARAPLAAVRGGPSSGLPA